MLARSYTVGLEGVDGYPIIVEADVRMGLPGLTVVGRAQGATGETKDRVRSALAHCGHEVRPRRQIVNLAPAHRRKDSPGLDLAVACALLASHEVVPVDRLSRIMFWGELGLDGCVRPASGTLVVADCARRLGFATLAVAREAAAEAAMIPGLEVIPVGALPELVAHLRGERVLEPFAGEPRFATDDPTQLDLADVRGQDLARLAVEVMAAGGHNLLLHGSPGVGKTMLARRAGALLPDLSIAEALEVTKIQSVARGVTPSEPSLRPPVRMPHHTVSPAGLLGGGHPVRPGEVSLAHHGLLFLDELPEFSRGCIEGLREPLEAGHVDIARASGRLRFPARFQLMAAMNPCPCGYAGHPERTCTDPLPSVERYRHRISGPFLDRVDLVVPMQRPARSTEVGAGPSTADVRARVFVARDRQTRRLAGEGFVRNADIPGEGERIERLCALRASARRLLDELAELRQLSPRVRARIRRVARTIADLRRPDAALDEPLRDEDIAAAVQLRRPPEG